MLDIIPLLPRRLAVWLGLRKLTPGKKRPSLSVVVPAIDTGGAWRPDYRMQDPSKDPKEPYGSESSGTGSDHAWANCTMAAGAMAYAYHVHDQTGPWGGNMRHNQDDYSGGTDLYDLRTAWDRYGNQTLTIKSGAGWSAVKNAHNEGRAIVIQGEGNVPGSESFDGGHACVIAPETHSDGRWLFGDPLATGWQWVEPSAIETWAERLSSGILFAVSKVAVEEPEPEPEPEEPVPCPPCPPEGYTLAEVNAMIAAAVTSSEDKLLTFWMEWLRSPPPGPFDVWDGGAWSDAMTRANIQLTIDPCNPDPLGVAHWTRDPQPFPVYHAATAIETPGTWDGCNWREAHWQT